MQLRTNRNKTVLREAHDRMSHSCPDNSAALHGVPLGGLTRGDKARIIALDEAAVITSLAPGELERRLIEMGLIEGAWIEVLHEGSPRRDPIAVRVDDHTVALRRAEANAVIVTLEPGGIHE